LCVPGAMHMGATAGEIYSSNALIMYKHVSTQSDTAVSPRFLFT